MKIELIPGAVIEHRMAVVSMIICFAAKVEAVTVCPTVMLEIWRDPP